MKQKIYANGSLAMERSPTNSTPCFYLRLPAKMAFFCVEKCKQKLSMVFQQQTLFAVDIVLAVALQTGGFASAAATVSLHSFSTTPLTFLVSSLRAKCNMLHCMSIIHVFFHFNLFPPVEPSTQKNEYPSKMERPTFTHKNEHIFPCLNYGFSFFF